MKAARSTGEPTTIGPYRVVEVLSQRGLYREYRVAKADGGEYSLRTLLYAGAADPETLERYRREATLLSRLSHPNLVEIVDWGFWDQASAYFLSPLTPGERLEKMSVPVAWPQVRPWLAQLLAGVGYLHQEGIVHRNLTPSSLHVGGDGVLRIVDFSLVSGGQPWTATGTTLGDFQYVAPEQIADAKRADVRADLYSVGVIAYQVLSGHLPREGWRFQDVRARLLVDAGRPLTDWVPTLAPAVLAFVSHLIDPDKAQRPASALEAAQRLPA